MKPFWWIVFTNHDESFQFLAWCRDNADGCCFIENPQLEFRNTSLHSMGHTFNQKLSTAATAYLSQPTSQPQPTDSPSLLCHCRQRIHGVLGVRYWCVRYVMSFPLSSISRLLLPWQRNYRWCLLAKTATSRKSRILSYHKKTFSLDYTLHLFIIAKVSQCPLPTTAHERGEA